MNPSNLSLRQKSRGTVVKTIAIHLYGARDPNYIVDLTQVLHFIAGAERDSGCDVTFNLCILAFLVPFVFREGFAL